MGLPNTGTRDDGPSLSQVLASPRGRLPRLDMLFAIVCVTVMLALAGLIWRAFALPFVPPGANAALTPLIGLPLIALALAEFSIVVCVLAKRCHDRNRSAWFLLILLIPALQLWPLIELICLRGSRDANRYGLAPLGMYGQWQAANRDL